MREAIDLERFLAAQAPVWEAVQRELRTGAKRSHWMWFVFPQLAGLGHSTIARYYALASLEEARAYLAHTVLGHRLLACTALVNDVRGRSAYEIFGTPDELKLKSCMTLFAQAAPTELAFQSALDRFYGGEPDVRTLELLGRD